MQKKFRTHTKSGLRGSITCVFALLLVCEVPLARIFNAREAADATEPTDKLRMGLVRRFHSFEFTDEIHQYVLGPVFDQRFGFGPFLNLTPNYTCPVVADWHPLQDLVWPVRGNAKSASPKRERNVGRSGSVAAYHSLKSPACSCISTTTKKPHASENRAAFIGHYPRPRRLTTQPLRDQPHANCLRLRNKHARECRV